MFGIFKKNRRSLLNLKKEFKTIIELEKDTVKRFDTDEADFHPCLNDNTSNTNFDRHYVYHPAWAARIVRDIKPAKHVDISSTLHFCSILSAFIPTEFYDYRPANLQLTNLKSGSVDLTKLSFPTNSIESLSCMHTVEHIGLGRYGDPLDYDGDLKAINELKRVVAIEGTLLFVVPIGNRSKICFNAHRVYTKEHIVNLFREFTLEEFVLIPESEDDGGLVSDPSQELLKRQSYGCGCFYFKKK